MFFSKGKTDLGYQISNLGILWIVLIVHLINAGYGLYGLISSRGGEVVLCCVALCLFSAGRWLSSCSDRPCPPPRKKKGRCAARIAGDPDMMFRVDDESGDVDTSEMDYIQGSSDNPKSADVFLRTDLWDEYGICNNLDSGAGLERCTKRGRLQPMQEPSVDTTVARPIGEAIRVQELQRGYAKVFDRRNRCRRRDQPNMSIPTKFLPKDYCSTDDPSDLEILTEECSLEKPRVNPSEIDLPELSYYHGQDRFAMVGNGNEGQNIPPQNEPIRDSFDCRQAAEEKRRMRQMGLRGRKNLKRDRTKLRDVLEKDVSCWSSRVPYRLGYFKNEAGRVAVPMGPRVGPVKRSKLRSFSPLPADYCGDPFDLPGPVRRLQAPQRCPSYVRYVGSTRGIADCMRDPVTGVSLDTCVGDNNTPPYRGFAEESKMQQVRSDFPVKAEYEDGRCPFDECEVSRPYVNERVERAKHRGVVRQAEWPVQDGEANRIKPRNKGCDCGPLVFTNVQEEGAVKARARRNDRRVYPRDANNWKAGGPYPEQLIALDKGSQRGDANLSVRIRKNRRRDKPRVPRGLLAFGNGRSLAERNRGGQKMNTNLSSAFLAISLLVGSFMLIQNMQKGLTPSFTGNSGHRMGGYILALASSILYYVSKGPLISGLMPFWTVNNRGTMVS